MTTFHFRKPCPSCAENERRVRLAERAVAGSAFALSEQRLEKEDMRTRAAANALRADGSDNEVARLRREVNDLTAALEAMTRRHDAARKQVAIWRTYRGEHSLLVEKVTELQEREEVRRALQERDDRLAARGRVSCKCQPFGTVPGAQAADEHTDHALRNTPAGGSNGTPNLATSFAAASWAGWHTTAEGTGPEAA